MLNVFEEKEAAYTGPTLTADMVHRVEEEMGYTLPRSYVSILHELNGGYLRKRCFATPFATSWAPDHIKINGIIGIGGELSIADSPYLIDEWGYPNVGLVVGLLPSGGHDTIMLDYSNCEPDGEPAVVYVDEDRIPKQIGSSFEEFLSGLRPCEEFDD